jgi:hypothetical protein
VSRLHKATKHSRKLRMALDGPAGSGKTFTALSIGTVLADHVAVIDTERSSASLYADLFPFAVAKRSRSGDSFGAWREVTPIHNDLVDAVLRYPGHVIATMRTKTEYIVEQGPNGKTRPVKVGLAPIQRAGIDFEFDLVGDLDAENNMVISKSRMSAVSGKVINRPGRKLAEELLAWLNDGDQAPESPAPPAGEATVEREPIERVVKPGHIPLGAGATDSPPWAKTLHIQAAELGIDAERFDAIVADYTPNGTPSANDIPDQRTANKVAKALAQAVRS